MVRAGIGSTDAGLEMMPLLDLLALSRVPDALIFGTGALPLAWFALRLWMPPGRDPDSGGRG